MRMEGDTKIEAVHFKERSGSGDDNNAWKREGFVEYFIKPDVVIAEAGLGPPKVDLSPLIANKDVGETGRVGIDLKTGYPAANIRFSLMYNDIQSPLYAAGSGTWFPSFFHKIRMRTPDMKYNMEAGFFAAMSMLDKRIEFRYIPMTPLKVGDK